MAVGGETTDLAAQSGEAGHDRDSLLAFLTAQGLGHRTYDHRPVFTVAEGADIKAQLPGGHTKNLFLDDRRGGLFLVSALSDTDVPVNRLHHVLGSRRLSFGASALLWSSLGVRPGSVTIFAMINDHEKRVTPVLDQGLFAHEIVNFHPLRNDATTAIAPADLERFLRALGRVPVVIDFAAVVQTHKPSRP